MLYVFLFFVVNFAGISMFSEPVWAPYLETSSTSAPDGSAWVDDQNLLWAYGGTEFRIEADSTDAQTGGGSAVSGPGGSVWVDSTRIYYIDQNQDRRWVEGEYVTSVGTAYAGSAWVDPNDGLLHYIDENGDQRRMEQTHPER